MKKSLTWLRLAVSAGATVLVLGTASLAARAATSTTTTPAAAAAETKYSGRVVAVDTTKNTITIHSKKTGDMTFSISPDTKIMVNEAKGASADIKTDMHIAIHSTDGKTATKINAHDDAHMPKKAEPGATPAPTAP